MTKNNLKIVKSSKDQDLEKKEKNKALDAAISQITDNFGKVFKGKKMAGHMGAKKVTIQNLKVVDVDTENNLLIIKGSVPGKKNSTIIIKDSIKKS